MVDRTGNLVVSLFQDTARNLSKVQRYLAYIQAKINSYSTNQILVDYSSGLEIAPRSAVRKAGLAEIPLPRPLLIQLANRSTVIIESYIAAQMVISNVISDLYYLVIGDNANFDFIVGIS